MLSGNTSSEDLDKFSEQFIDQEEGEEEEMGGPQEVTMTTSPGPKEQTRVNSPNAASFPVSLVRTRNLDYGNQPFSRSDVSLRQCSLKFRVNPELNPS